MSDHQLAEPGFGPDAATLSSSSSSDDDGVAEAPHREERARDRRVVQESKDAGEEEDEEEDDDDAPTYTPKQLTSLLPPVSTTMLLASLIIVNVRSDDIDNLLSTSLGTYAVSSYIPTAANATDSDDDSFLYALLNAAVIIAGIALLTFGIVLCYKFKCYKFLYGFFTFTIFVALGFETGQILYAFFEKFQVAADWPSLVFVLFNFAIAGAVGILYGKIVPRMLSQGYLIWISICICYLLRYFPEWTGWILLVLLALWDLFAVLAPCGPLKALVKMASERQDPIPGLLYTAGASADTEIRVARSDNGDDSTDEEDDDGSGSSTGTGRKDVRVHVAQATARPTTVTTGTYEVEGGDANDPDNVGASDVNDGNFGVDFDDDSDEDEQSAEPEETARATITDGGAGGGDGGGGGGGGGSGGGGGGGGDDGGGGNQPNSGSAGEAAQLDSDAALARRLHEEELSERAVAALAAEEGYGGAGASTPDDEAAAAAAARAVADEEEEEEEDHSVKLGLGDFIFYSLLVGKAALSGWVAFAICFVVILCGLLSTMILLALLKKPLPALPFSMLFGVSFYFWAQYTLGPQCTFMVLNGLYV